MGPLPFKYLRIPIEANMNHIKNWKDVVDIFETKLFSWKARSLSFGGRITQLKPVLGSLPIYYFSLFKAPILVIETLERIRRRFLWSGSNWGHIMHWINWNRIIAPKEIGGLDIGSLRSMNLVILSKRWWCAKAEEGSLTFSQVSKVHRTTKT